MGLKRIFYLIPVVLMLLFYWAIARFVLEKSEKSPIYNYIPGEVSQVIQVNPTQIMKKFVYERVFREKQTLERLPNADKRLEKNVSEDPGINFFAPLLFLKENWAQGDVWMVLLELNDGVKFDVFLEGKSYDDQVIVGRNDEVAIFAITFGPDKKEISNHIDNILQNNFKPLNLNDRKLQDFLTVDDDITFMLTNRKYSEQSIFELIHGKVNFERDEVSISAVLDARDIIPYESNDYLALKPFGFHLTSLVPPEELLPFVLPESISFPALPKSKYFSLNITGIDVLIMGEDDTLTDEKFIVTPLIEMILMPEDKAGFESYLNQQISDSILVSTNENHTYSIGYKQALNIRPLQDDYYLISTTPQKEVKAEMVALEHIASMEVEIQDIFDNISIRMPNSEETLANSLIEKTIAGAVEKQLVGFENLRRFEFYVDPSDETHLNAYGHFYFNAENSHSIVELLILVEEIDRLHLF